MRRIPDEPYLGSEEDAGTLKEVVREYQAICGDCRRVVAVRAINIQNARRALRKRSDWSLGRDKKWRCHECRPRRFGE